MLVDCDDVVADCNTAILAKANEIGQLNPPLTKEACRQWDIFKEPRVKPFKDELWKAINDTPGWIAGLKPHLHAIHAIHRIGMFAEVSMCTSSVASPHYHFERIEWAEKHIGLDRKHIIFAHPKFKVDGDFLIDDRPDNCFAWTEAHPEGTAILLANEMNIWDRRHSDRVVFTNDWDRIEKMIRRTIP